MLGQIFLLLLSFTHFFVNFLGCLDSWLWPPSLFSTSEFSLIGSSVLFIFVFQRNSLRTSFCASSTAKGACPLLLVHSFVYSVTETLIIKMGNVSLLLGGCLPPGPLLYVLK